MAAETERLDESNKGCSNVEANLPACHVESTTPQTGSGPSGEVQSTESSYDHLPPELRPVNGKFPELNEALMRRLRGKYFTVKHPRLAACDHKMDLMNEPRTNCQDCWFAWFNTHQKLVEVADEMYRAKGKEALIGMRGKKFFKFFVRFMVTIIQLAKEQEQRESTSRVESGAEGTEQTGSSVLETAVAGGQAEGSGNGSEVTE